MLELLFPFTYLNNATCIVRTGAFFEVPLDRSPSPFGSVSAEVCLVILFIFFPSDVLFSSLAFQGGILDVAAANIPYFKHV